MNKHFELLEFVFNSVCIMRVLSLLLLDLCACVVCVVVWSSLVVLGLSVRLSWYASFMYSNFNIFFSFRTAL